jgi:hypothetical protein
MDAPILLHHAWRTVGPTEIAAAAAAAAADTASPICADHRTHACMYTQMQTCVFRRCVRHLTSTACAGDWSQGAGQCPSSGQAPAAGLVRAHLMQACEHGQLHPQQRHVVSHTRGLLSARPADTCDHKPVQASSNSVCICCIMHMLSSIPSPSINSNTTRSHPANACMF